MALIEAKDVTKVYGEGTAKTFALAGITFAIDPGEFVAIMGPSGSGKSTLLHVLGFLDGHTDGTYHFDGKTRDDYTEVELAHVRNGKMGFIFQAFNLLARASVLDNVLLPLTYSQVPKREWLSRAHQQIEAVGLTKRMYHEPSQLSGGEKQRVAIARAMVLYPDIIFADEPTGNLDTASGGVVMEILSKLHRDENKTIVLITHETYTAQFADRVIKLRDGKVESDIRQEARRNGRGEFKK